MICIQKKSDELDIRIYQIGSGSDHVDIRIPESFCTPVIGCNLIASLSVMEKIESEIWNFRFLFDHLIYVYVMIFVWFEVWSMFETIWELDWCQNQVLKFVKITFLWVRPEKSVKPNVKRMGTGRIQPKFYQKVDQGPKGGILYLLRIKIIHLIMKD